MNKKNNKGFSLVELIVVVAIMAVLVGVLAPAYLRYVEKSRVQKDNSAVAEVVEATKIALSEEAVADEVTFGASGTKVVITVSGNKGIIAVTGASGTALETEIENTVGDEIAIASKECKAYASYTITLTSETEVTGAWVTSGTQTPAPEGGDNTQG